MTDLAGSLVGIASPGGSGSGFAAANYLSANNTSNVTPTTSLTAIQMTLDQAIGSPGVAIDGTDSTKIDVSATGIYVVQLYGSFGWTSQVAGGVNYVGMGLDFAGVADPNSLARFGGPWRTMCAYNEAGTSALIDLFLTMPPIRLAAGDYFHWLSRIGVAATALTAPVFSAMSSNLNVTRLG